MDATKGATLGPGGNVSGQANNATDIAKNLGTYKTSASGARSELSDKGLKVVGSNGWIMRFGDSSM